MVGIIQSGVVLDARTLGTSGERRVVVAALRQLTGKDFGVNARAWRKWLRANP